MKILFNKNIPADVVAHFVREGHTVHIFGGGELFNKTKPVFKMAKQAGVNEAFIHFGDIRHIIDNNRIEMFMSDDEKHSTTKVFAKYVPDTIDLSTQLNFKRVLLERWKTQSSLTKGGESCPICLTLEKLDWVEANQPVTYTWSSGSKIIFGLPPYRQSHSQIGDGNWKVGDQFCKCFKEFKSEIIPDDQQFSSKELVVVIPDHTQCQNH
jgi:hypothetical protein